RLFTGNRDIAAMGDTQFLHQGQTDANTLELASGGIISLPEPAEYVCEICRRDSHSRIQTNNYKFLALFFGSQFTAAAARSKFERVEHEVQDNLLEFIAISHDSAKGRVDECFQPQPFVFSD